MSVQKKTEIRQKQKNYSTHIIKVTWLQLKETIAATEEILSKYLIYQEIFETLRRLYLYLNIKREIIK